MLFLFKRRKIVIDAFVSKKFSHAYDYNSIDHAYNFYPDWWKKLPKPQLNYHTMTPEKNMKGCIGLIEHYKRGLVIPMWSDLMIKTDGRSNYSYQFSDTMSSCESHPNIFFKGFYDVGINLKLISPWLLSSEKNVYFTFLPTMWNNTQDPGYKTLVGTVDFYKQKNTNINLILDEPKEIYIRAGTPMLHIMPLSDREIVINKHVIDDAEWYRKNNSNLTSFFGSFYKFKTPKNQEKKFKCPFSF
jgi:hypothetical protein